MYSINSRSRRSISDSDLRGLVYAPNGLRDVPMACLMDISLDSGGAGRPDSSSPREMPSAVSCVPRRRQKKRHMMQVRACLLRLLEVLIQRVVVAIS